MAIKLGLGVGGTNGFIANVIPVDPSIYKFTLPLDSKVSAAVYDGDDNLLRTLFDSVDYVAGTHVETWDELDYEGNPIVGTYGVDWVIKIGYHQSVATWQGAMVGNTSSVEYGSTKLRSFARMTGNGALAGGGRLYLACSYAEGISSGKRIDLSNITLKANDVLNYDGVSQQSQFVCTDGNIVYWAGFDPFGNANSWVFGTYVHDDSEVEFSSGTPYSCVIGRTYDWAINLKTGGSTEYCTGIAVSDTYLYVAMGGIDEIAIINKTTGALVATESGFTNPRGLAINGTDLWMITDANTVRKCALSGTTITSSLTLSGLTAPLNVTASQSLYRYYYQSTNSDISGYEVGASWLPFGVEVNAAVAVNANATEFLIQEFASNLGDPYATSIPAGTWTFNTYAACGNNGVGNNILRYRIYKRSQAGTETQLFTVDSSAIIPSLNLDYNLLTTNSVQGALTIDPTDRIIVKIYAIRPTGFATSVVVQIAWDGATRTSNFTFAPDDNYVYVVDGGTSQQIKQYDTAGAAGFTHGTAGGYDNGPAVTNAKFYFSDGVTELAELPTTRSLPFAFPMLDETYWVFEGGCERLQHFQSDFTYIERIMWLPHSYSVEVDKNNPTRVFNEYRQFEVPLDAPEDWELVYNWRYRVTADYWQDFMIGILSQVTEFPNGETYAQLKNIPDDKQEFVRLDTSTGLVFTGVQTDDFQVVYLDTNGDQYFLDCGGNVTNTVTWKKKTLTGFSSLNPTYAAATNVATGPNVPANGPLADPSFNFNYGMPVKTENDYMVLYNTGIVNTGFHLGITPIGASTYSAKVMPSTYTGAITSYGYQGYIGPYPENCYYDIGNEVTNAGAQVYSAGAFIVAAYQGEFWKGLQTNEYHLIHQNGMQLMVFGTQGWIAEAMWGEQAPKEMAGNIFSGGLTISGNYLYLKHCDESYHSATHCWRIPINTFTIVNAALWHTYTPPAGVDVLEDLPFRSVLSDVGNITRIPNADYYTDGNNYWNVQTGRNTYTTDTNDILVRFRSNTNDDAYVDFAITPTVTTEWSLEGQIIFENNLAHWDDLVGVYLQVLDDTDKIIADFTQASDLDSVTTNFIEGNGTSILSFPAAARAQYISVFKGFSITVNASGCDFTYDGNAINNIAMRDPTADWTMPSKVRIMCIGNGFEYSQELGLKTLRYYEI